MKRRIQQEMANLRAQRVGSSVMNDVIKTDLEAYPGHLEQVADDRMLTNVEEAAVKHKGDAKTWLSDRY